MDLLGVNSSVRQRFRGLFPRLEFTVSGAFLVVVGYYSDFRLTALHLFYQKNKFVNSMRTEDDLCV